MRKYGCKSFDVFVGDTERGQSDFLRELSELRIGEEWHVTEQLVTNVRFRRVQRLAGVADVLRRVEHPES